MKWYTHYTEAGRVGWLLADKGIPTIPSFIPAGYETRDHDYLLQQPKFPISNSIITPGYECNIEFERYVCYTHHSADLHAMVVSTCLMEVVMIM